MKISGKILFIVFIFALQSLYAGVTPRIDLQGSAGKVQFSKLKVFGSDKSKISLARWKWVKGDSYAIAAFYGVKSKVWTRIGIKFTPTAGGDVKLMLLANRLRNKEGIVYYDNIEVSGAEIVNPDFEEINSASGLPVMWKRMNLNKNVEIEASFFKGCKKSGNVSAQVHHDSRIYQLIKVNKGKPVIIEAWVYVP
jgi:hypothetical protein